jgi:pyruvyltransferase
MARNVYTYLSRPKGLKYGNFGDELTLPLLHTLFDVNAIPVSMQKAELIATGSILDSFSRARLRRRVITHLLSRRDTLHVWGSGFMVENTSLNWPRPTLIHAVRGQLTASRLTDFNGAIGDPGILSSILIATPSAARSSVCLIPHFVDREYVEKLDLPKHWTILNPDAPPLDVINGISQSELVISSSLHGLIVADSCGTPCIWARSQNPLHLNSVYKFYDHESARLSPFNKPVSYTDSIELNEVQLRDLSSTPARNIAAWQSEIIKSFPESLR